MKIWLINHYAVPPQYYPLARPSLIAKNLIKMGHEVSIIAASTVHNSDKTDLIHGRTRVKRIINDGIPYYLIKCTRYNGNGLRRLFNIVEFAFFLPIILDKYDKPDVIIATSFDPLSCYAGIRYAKKINVKAIAEIADLWPETLVAYNGVSSHHPIVRILRLIEKNIYLQADYIIFTMEGAYNYIIEQGWQGVIPKSKVFYVNNGIDLEEFDFNQSNYQINDDDLNNVKQFNVVYTGSIRKVNNVDKILDIAKLIKNNNICFLIWGDGDEVPELNRRIEDEQITNVKYKGSVEKKYVPYITSKADLNLIHNTPSPLFRFGISFNKLFDYLAAGKPTITDFPSNNNPAVDGNSGIDVKDASAEKIAEAIDYMSNLSPDLIATYGYNARKTAEKYDFHILTKTVDKLIRSD